MTGKPTRTPALPTSGHPAATKETPFCQTDAFGQHLFAVCEGVDAGTALSMAASMMRTAHGLLISELSGDDGPDAAAWLIDAATAIVDAVNHPGGQL